MIMLLVIHHQNKTLNRQAHQISGLQNHQSVSSTVILFINDRQTKLLTINF